MGFNGILVPCIYSYLSLNVTLFITRLKIMSVKGFPCKMKRYPFTNNTCSFSTNNQLQYPRPAPIWPCSSVGRETVICFPSLICSFTTNYHLNYPRPVPIWPCSSVGRATVICSRGRVFEFHQGK